MDRRATPAIQVARPRIEVSAKLIFSVLQANVGAPGARVFLRPIHYFVK
jgi:hypothetical protein